jgi:hypothetical protein
LCATRAQCPGGLIKLVIQFIRSFDHSFTRICAHIGFIVQDARYSFDGHTRRLGNVDHRGSFNAWHFWIILAVQNAFPGVKTASLRPDRNDELRQDFDLGLCHI